MDGVDGIFVGPFDLSIALGHPGEFNAPVVHDAILRVQAACKRSGKLSIIFTGSAAASRQRFAEGFDSVTLGMDSPVLCRDVQKSGSGRLGQVSPRRKETRRGFPRRVLFIPSLPASVPLRTLPGQSPFPHWQYPAPAWSPLPDVAVHIHGVGLVQLSSWCSKPFDNQVHGGLDPGFGLAEVLPLHPGSLKLRVGVQQLLGSRQVVVQEGIDPVSLLRVLLHRPEDLGGDGLQPVDLGRESRVRDGVVGPADPPQDSGAALLRLLGGRRRGRLLPAGASVSGPRPPGRCGRDTPAPCSDTPHPRSSLYRSSSAGPSPPGP